MPTVTYISSMQACCECSWSTARSYNMIAPRKPKLSSLEEDRKSNGNVIVVINETNRSRQYKIHYVYTFG